MRRVLLIAWLALLCACGGEPSYTQQDAAILERGNGPEPESLDPQKARQDSSLNILRDLFEGLTSLDPDAGVIPGAAQSWTVSEDGLIYTFHLRPGLRWSNGAALTAEDFLFSLRRLVNPVTASQYAQILEPVMNAADIVRGRLPPEALGVTAPDAHTLVIQLASPTPYLLHLLAHPSTFPVARASLLEGGRIDTRPGALISNGAFELREWIVGSHVAVSRNPHYRDAATVKLDGVRFFHMPDAGGELRRYRAGQLHFTYTVPGQQLGWIRQNIPEQLHIGPQLSVYYYGFNLTRPPFRDQPQLRRALSMVIDRERLTRQVTGLGELPACSWVPAGTANYTPQTLDYCEWPYEQRIAEALRLYTAAGYSSDRPLEVELRYTTGEVHNRIAVAVAAMWKEALGVRTNLYAEELSTLNQNIQARRVTQVFRASWVGDYNDAWTFAQLLHSRFGINLTGYANQRYDALLSEAAGRADPALRRADLESAERLMLADHPVVPLYFYVNKHLVTPSVQGYRSNVMNVQYSRNLWLAE